MGIKLTGHCKNCGATEYFSFGTGKSGSVHYCESCGKNQFVCFENVFEEKCPCGASYPPGDPSKAYGSKLSYFIRLSRAKFSGEEVGPVPTYEGDPCLCPECKRIRIYDRMLPATIPACACGGKLSLDAIPSCNSCSHRSWDYEDNNIGWD